MRRLATLAATALAVGLSVGLATAAPAGAIPDNGASQDTPGTSVTTSPKSLPVGGTLSFRVTGFPAGEVVYIKIDDGTFCSSSAVHGACVVHQQRLDAHGAASGSFALPSDVETGKHWLRLLASQQVAGSGGGVKGYTARGSSDFTVTAASKDTTATKSAASAAGSTAGGSAAQSPAAGSPAAGSPVAGTGAAGSSDVPVPSAGATLRVDLPAPAVTVTVTATPSAAAGTTAASTRPVASTGTPKHHPPYAGITGLVVLGGLAGLLVALRARRVRRPGA